MNKEILEITKKFHDTYEKLASEYTYETREDTKVFDINSNNGKLMYATVNEIVSPILEENQELKKQLEELKEEKQEWINLLDMFKNQQKEFIEYMNKTIEELECDNVDDEEMKGYLIQRIYTFKEILSKYKEIIGDDK